MKKILFIALAGIAIMASCKKTESTTPAPTVAKTYSYKTDIAPIFAASCNKCHADYATYAGVQADTAVIPMAVSTGAMPSGSTLTADQKAAIAAWFKAGAKNN